MKLYALAGVCICLLANCLVTGHAETQSAAPNAAPAATTEASKPAPPPKVDIKVLPKGITLIARQADAHEVLFKLGAATGKALIVNQSVNDKFTLVLRDKTLEEILEAIATGYGLSWRKLGGFYMISKGIPEDPASYLLSDIATIPLNYVRASEAKSLLPVFLQDYVHVNAQQNAVVLSAPKEVLAKFEKDVKQFDQPAEQILLDVLMVEVTSDASDELASAINWVNNTNRIYTESNTGLVHWESEAQLTDQFYAKLTALETQGKARVRAQPSIATVSGQPASIFIGEEKYLKTSVQMVGQFEGRSAETKTSIQAGIRLNVMAWTGGKGTIIASISPEISTLSADDPVTGLPEMSSRNASTMLRLKGGQTVVIGGLTQREKHVNEGGIPLLKDLPLIGPLFRHRSNDNVDTELVIFVTPRILSSTGHLPAAEEKALKQKFGLDKFQQQGGTTKTLR